MQLRAAAAATASPFSTSPAAYCAAPRPPVGSDVGGGRLARAPSSSLGLARRSSSSLAPPPSRSRSGHCCATLTDVVELVATDSSAAAETFETLSEALGDVSKLSQVVGGGGSSGAASAASAAAAAARLPVDVDAAASWGLEKLVAAAAGCAALEGLVDRTLLDLFAQVFASLELAGGAAASSPWLRLAVAVGVAAAVRISLSRYRAAHPGRLRRQLSPAASLSDAIAEAAGAALMSAAGLVGGAGGSGKQQQQQHEQPQLQLACAGHSHSMMLDDAPAQQPPHSSSSSAPLQLVQRHATSVARALALAGGGLVAGQLKRAAKLKRQAKAVASEVASSRQFSPAALLVCIEAAALVHSYSEMAQGLATLASGGGGA